MPKSVYEILSRCQLFAQVHEDRRRRLAEFSHIRKFTKRQMVFRQGEPCPGVFIVDSGLVRVFKTSAAGKEHVLHICGPNYTFAEVAAIAGFDCPANAEAIAPTTCALVPQDMFRKQMQEDHQLCLEMIAGLSFWVRHVFTLLEDIVLRDATGRVSRFLLEADRDPDGTVKLPSLKRHVASHLNLTSETFSRTLSRLIEAGLLIEHDGSRVELKDLQGLQAVSEGLFPEV